MRQVEWSLNNIPENNAIVGELVFAFGAFERLVYICLCLQV